MSRVAILTDSIADVPPEVARQLGITVVPAYVQIEGRSLRDGAEITRAELYSRLPGLAQLPTTSSPSVYDFTMAFRKLVGQVREVIAIHVARSVSSILDMARLGSAEVPELDVYMVDSGQLTMAEGWQVIAAAEAAAAGKGRHEIVDIIRSVQARVRLVAMLDTLEYLRRSGRVAWVRASAARLLSIKPIIEFKHGEAVLIGQVRTRHKAIERLAEIVSSWGPLERLALLHTHAPDFDVFCERMSTLFDTSKALISEVGPAVGVHVGPRGLGIAAITAA
jgi:DegV family protein with EDD domain